MASIITQVTAGERIVIPAEIRRKMDIQCGDQVLLSYHDGELHIASRKRRLQQAKAIVQADASALLAYLRDETGSEAVEGVLSKGGGVVSTVNYAEAG